MDAGASAAVRKRKSPVVAKDSNPDTVQLNNLNPEQPKLAPPKSPSKLRQIVLQNSVNNEVHVQNKPIPPNLDHH